MERHGRIVAVLEDFQKRFSEAYAVAISVTEVMPEQINNEMRNALTHLARASVAHDEVRFAAEVDAAERHVERAIRDCYKVAIIEKRELIDKCSTVIQVTRGGFTKNIADKISSTIVIRKEILLDEQRTNFQPLGDQKVTIRYERLYALLEEVHTEIREQYGLTDERAASFPRCYRLTRIISWAGSLAVAYILGILTNYSTDSVIKLLLDDICGPLARYLGSF